MHVLHWASVAAALAALVVPALIRSSKTGSSQRTRKRSGPDFGFRRGALANNAGVIVESTARVLVVYLLAYASAALSLRALHLAWKSVRALGQRALGLSLPPGTFAQAYVESVRALSHDITHARMCTATGAREIWGFVPIGLVLVACVHLLQKPSRAR